MVFSSTVFIFIFLPVVLIFDRILPEKVRNYFLVFASLFFFSWSQPKYLWILIANIFINYIGALLASRNQGFIKRFCLVVTLILNLVLLFYFKYFDFFIETVNNVFHLQMSLRNIILPIGISFFTFQGMSYTIDVYCGKAQVQKNVFKLALYIVLFPQLVAGPIIRYVDIAETIDNRKKNKEDFYIGICRFIIGLGKKAILANSLAVIVDQIWTQGADQNTVAVAWLGSIAYTLQIYFDFSGYSDMAIGIGRMLGFHFMENFKLPYISRNISEFWRRWHISLSSWFRDYVYIPLGGNRKRVYLNLLIVFLLTGMWHGASWNFVMWGGWNAIFILLERILHNRKKKTVLFIKLKMILSHIYTLFVVNIGWIIFRAVSLNDAWKYIKTMLRLDVCVTPKYGVMWYLDRWNIAILLIAILYSTTIPHKAYEILNKKISSIWMLILYNTALVLIFAFAMVRVVSGTYNPFIYFQF